MPKTRGEANIIMREKFALVDVLNIAEPETSTKNDNNKIYIKKRLATGMCPVYGNSHGFFFSFGIKYNLHIHSFQRDRRYMKA